MRSCKVSRFLAGLGAAGVIGVGTHAARAQQYQFQHTTSIDLSPSFFGPGPMGEPSSGFGSNPLNVVFDGTHAYVAGFNGSGSTDMVGIVRVNNPLSLSPSLTNLSATQIADVPASRGINGLAYSPTTASLIYAYDTGSAATGVISRRNASDGAEVWSIVSPQAARPFVVGVDPTGDGGNPGVAFFAQGSGRRRLLSLTDGATIFDGTNGGIINPIPVPPTSLTTWRGMAFDPQGNVAVSSSTVAGYGLRAAVNQWTDLAANPNGTARSVLKSPDVNLVGAGVGILDAMGAGGSTDLLAFNGRTLSSGDEDFDVNLTPLNGSPEVVDARDIHIRNTDGSTTGLGQISLSGNEDGLGSRWNSEPKELAFGLDGAGRPVLLVVSFSDRRLDTYSLEPTWTNPAGGTWSTSGNWLLGFVPDSALDNARFGPAITSAASVTVDGPKTVKALKFDNTNSYTLSGPGSITLDSPGTPLINVNQGHHTVAVPITLAKSTQIDVNEASSLSAKRFTGAGLMINSGLTRILPDGTANGTSNVTSLDIAGGVLPTAMLDITNNAVVVNYTPVPPGPDEEPFDTIRAQIAFAYNGGAWNNNGITSSQADASQFGVGYSEASALPSIPAIFGTVDADAVLIRFTRYGDANLDGLVNLQDFNRLAGNFGASGTANWDQGDFNYDGNVNLQDFNRLAGNFGLSAGPDGPTPEDWSALASAIPEPGAGVMLSAAALTVLRRRARRSRFRGVE